MHSQAARIVDANLNRAREALRVIEDYARFVLNDGIIAEELKRLRHALATAVQTLPPGILLAARDTAHDVGTSIQTTQEYTRTTPHHTAIANLKRLQEALRSAEEFGKQLNGFFAQALEQLRYQAYTLEKAIPQTHPLKQRLAESRLYVLITASQCAAPVEETVRLAAKGGATVFQMREKNLTDSELLERAIALRKLTRELGVLLVINDRPDIAMAANADGVHLGQYDLPIQTVRPMVGPDMLIGISTHDILQVRAAVLAGADYLGVGPTFPSTTKAFTNFPGLAFIKEASAQTAIPTFALGGIHAGNISSVVVAGATRVAVASAVTADKDSETAARRLWQSLDHSPVLS